MSGNEYRAFDESVGHLFRHHAGRMVSILTRRFGIENLELIEDSVQDALVVALKRWPFGGAPDDPQAWLFRVASNRVIDKLRQQVRLVPIAVDDRETAISELPDASAIHFCNEINEDQLAMVFACCHPAIARDSQVALTLKVVGGFSVSEIARAYFANDAAIAKMLTRAKKKLRATGRRLLIPPPAEMPARLDAALKAVYLMFNEGYGASAGENLLRKDLCFEAIRLVELLAAHPVTRGPRVHALAALVLFQAARFPARTDHAGELIVLADQNRSLWDQQLLGRGLRHFKLSAAGSEVSDYHIEAEIAALYSLAPSFEETDWGRILDCYNTLFRRTGSFAVVLNRAVVIGMADGPEAALHELEELSRRPDTRQSNLRHIATAHFLSAAGRMAEAEAEYAKALDLTRNGAVKSLIEKRVKALRAVSSAGFTEHHSEKAVQS